MTAIAATRRMDAEEFLSRIETQEKGRYELYDGVDTSIKLTDYFRLSSVMHYLIVDLQHRLALHYRRDGAQIALAVVDGGDVALDPPGLSIKLDDIFA